jgi:hypothetical protein
VRDGALGQPPQQVEACVAVAERRDDRGQQRGGPELWASRGDRGSGQGEQDVQHIRQRVVGADDGRLDLDVPPERA